MEVAAGPARTGKQRGWRALAVSVTPSNTEAAQGQESLSGLLLDALLMPVTVSGTQPALKKYLLNE